MEEIERLGGSFILWSEHFTFKYFLFLTALPEAFRYYVRNRVSFRNQKLQLVVWFLFWQLVSKCDGPSIEMISLALNAVFHWSLWMSFISQCYIKLNSLKNEMQYYFQSSLVLMG
jgi:hypothetical protein